MRNKIASILNNQDGFIEGVEIMLIIGGVIGIITLFIAALQTGPNSIPKAAENVGKQIHDGIKGTTGMGTGTGN